MSKNLYAIIKSGSREYKVTPGKSVKYERLDAEPGDSVEFDQISRVVNGDQVVNGEPCIEGARVRAHVVKHENEKGIIVFRLKRRILFHRKSKHRLSFTKLKIDEIIVDDIVFNKSNTDPRKIKKAQASARQAGTVAAKRPNISKPKPVQPEPTRSVTEKNTRPAVESHTVKSQPGTLHANPRINGIWLLTAAVLVLGILGYVWNSEPSPPSQDKPVTVAKPQPADVRLRSTRSVDNPNTPAQPPD